MAELEVSGLRKSFGAQRVVEDISFRLGQGQLLTLLGPSGCGKSTTLRIVAGLTAPDAGQVRIGGQDVTRLRPAQRRIGMVFQSLALFPHMDVAGNIAFALKAQRVPAAEHAQRIATVLDRVQLAGFAQRYPAQISGGQRQRVALARALACDPTVLLLDEPFSALDRKLREEMQEELRGLVRAIGVTTLFVTHDQEEAIRLSDAIAVFHAGRLAQVATPQQVYDRPRTRFVAAFVGAPNFLPATMGAQGLVAHGEPVPLPPGAAPPDGAVTLNLRPERVVLSAERPPAGPAFAVRILGRVYEGAFTTWRVSFVADPTNAWLVRAQAEVAGLDGEAAWLSWRAEDTNILEGQT